MAFVSDSQLRLASWWAENRRKFLELRTVLFLAAVFLLLVTIAVQTAFLAATDRSLSEALAKRAERLTEIVRAAQPASLTTHGVGAVSAGPGFADLAGRITNPNRGWLVKTVTAHFTLGGSKSPSISTFVLPATADSPAERLVVLPRVSGTATGTPTLVVDSVAWQRVADRDLAVLGGEPVRVVSATLTPTTVSGSGAGTVADITLTNPSIYGYRQADVAVAVHRGGTLLGVGRVTVRNLSTGQKTPVRVAWAAAFPADATLTVDPAVNPFDSANRLPSE